MRNQRVDQNLPQIYFTEDEIMDVLQALIDIGADLQKQCIAHRNLKPQNIIINRNDSLRDLRLINLETGIIFDKKPQKFEEELKSFDKINTDIKKLSQSEVLDNSLSDNTFKSKI